MTEVRLDLAEEPVHLLPERALFVPRTSTLVTADLHWGKAATFRAAGIPIPRGGTGDDLLRLDAALARTAARRLVILGDLFHAKAGRVSVETLDELQRWRTAHLQLSILLVRGNHDRRAGDPPGELGIDCVDAPAADPPFVLQHHPSASDGGYALAGHLHPGLTLTGPALFRERLPCFVIGPRRAVLPAFGGFTGCHPVEPAFDERLYVVAGHEVLAVGAGLVQRARL